MFAVACGIILAVIFVALLPSLLTAIYKISEFFVILLLSPFVLAYQSRRCAFVIFTSLAMIIGMAFYNNDSGIFYLGTFFISWFSAIYFYNHRERFNPSHFESEWSEHYF